MGLVFCAYEGISAVRQMTEEQVFGEIDSKEADV